jgi:hypothetical protein
LSETVRIGEYEFLDFEPISGTQKGTCDIRRLDDEDIEQIDVKESKEILVDMGKWEMLIRAGHNLIKDLEIGPINEENREKYQRRFGKEKYSIELGQPKGKRVIATFILTKKQSFRLSHVEDIKEQLENILKWRSLIKAINQIMKATS